MTAMYRHGDVLLIRAGDATTPASDEPREVILALGEATGHAHRVTGPGATALDEAGAPVVTDWERERGMREVREAIERIRTLSLPAGGRITHEEHRALDLPPGLYDVVIQRTMDQAGRWRRVAD